MKIDLITIPASGKSIDELITFPDELLKTTSIKKLENVHVVGKVFYNLADEIILDARLTGTMILEDAMDLSKIKYPFDIKIDENLTTNDEYNLEKEQNTLDIMMVLWENIVLEVPIRIVKEENENKTLQGDGWELMNEDTKRVDPRLSPLLDLLKEGKE